MLILEVHLMSRISGSDAPILFSWVSNFYRNRQKRRISINKFLLSFVHIARFLVHFFITRQYSILARIEKKYGLFLADFAEILNFCDISNKRITTKKMGTMLILKVHSLSRISVAQVHTYIVLMGLKYQQYSVRTYTYRKEQKIH